MLWFYFILGSNFIFFCFWVWQLMYDKRDNNMRDNEFEAKENKI